MYKTEVSSATRAVIRIITVMNAHPKTTRRAAAVEEEEAKVVRGGKENQDEKTGKPHHLPKSYALEMPEEMKKYQSACAARRNMNSPFLLLSRNKESENVQRYLYTVLRPRFLGGLALDCCRGPRVGLVVLLGFCG